MRRRGLRLIALAALLGAGTVPATAQTAKGPAAPSKAQLDAAAFHMKVLMSALQSKEVDPPIKNVLFVCLYENPFGKISDATSKVLTGNKLDPGDANKVLTVMAGVCGLRPGEEGAAAKPAPKGAPPQQPQGR
jgi:hypothetical protein